MSCRRSAKHLIPVTLSVSEGAEILHFVQNDNVFAQSDILCRLPSQNPERSFNCVIAKQILPVPPTLLVPDGAFLVYCGKEHS
jgi:hypothetical protein